MTQIEDRVRSGLQAEAQAIGEATRTTRSTLLPQGGPLSGAGVAVGVAAVVLIVFGGVSLLSGGGGDVMSQPVPTPSTSLAAATSVPSTNPEGDFEDVPFNGETWQFTVTEEINSSVGTNEVCFSLEPLGAAANTAVVGPPWCDDWPKSDPRIAPYLLGVHYGLPSNTSFVIVVELNDQPVDRITVTGDGVDETVTPFTLPGSGKQFAVVEVPQSDGTITVAALDQTGAVLDQQEGIGRMDPILIDGTPIDDSTATKVATMMGGEPLSDEELERITGSAGLAHSGYLIESTTAGDGAYELGLIVYREEPLVPLDRPLVCFSPYAMTQGINVAGGATCADSQEKAEELAEFHLGLSGACGPHPKEEPVVVGIWTTIAVWGIPETAETLTIGLGNGTTVEIAARNGVALHLWEGSVDITSITFYGMTQAQRDLLSSWLPARGIGSDCGRGDTSGG